MTKRRHNKATEEALSELHGVIAKELKERLLSGEASPSDFSNAIKFLKDNGITADVEQGDPTDILKGALEELPFVGGLREVS